MQSKDKPTCSTDWTNSDGFSKTAASRAVNHYSYLTQPLRLGDGPDLVPPTRCCPQSAHPKPKPVGKCTRVGDGCVILQ